MKLPLHRTKIVATIGPASQSVEAIRKMLLAGMNVARLNFSHGDFETHRRAIANLREASAETGRRVAILADLPGPKLRIGEFEAGPVDLCAGDRFTLTTQPVAGNASRVSVTFANLPQVVRRGDALYLNDGYVQLEVEDVCGSDVVCRVVAGGELSSRKGLNLPGIALGTGAFTAADRDALEFALGCGADMVSQSFVECADDVEAVRSAAREFGHEPFVVAKIERARALDRLDEILAAADGVMIARGDLGVEVPIERIALVQKEIVRRAGRLAKPVIIATQMLESMTSHRLPTRAEATDVANAILDGTDAVMLSAESATGRFPVESVAMLARIAAAVEPSMPPRSASEAGWRERGAPPLEQLVADAVETTLTHALPAAVFVPTRSGASARRMSALRLPVWTVAVSADECTCRHLELSRGVAAVHEAEEPAGWSEYARRWVREHDLPGSFVVLTAGPSAASPGAHPRLELVEL